MLKSRNALLESDVRFRNMAGDANPDGSIRWMSIDDLHELVAPIELRPEVPAAVHVQFDKARHAFIYSWFAYDLVSLAEQQGYQALEFALRLRLPADEQRKAQEKRWTLDTLIKRAFAHGWLEDVYKRQSQRPGHRNRTQGHEHPGIERRAKRPLTHPTVADAHICLLYTSRCV